MKLHSISIRNFRLHADTDITFPEGIVGIIGTNEAGKSTILEAITWALFGGDATRGTRAGIRWHGAPARHTAAVVLHFEVGGRDYMLERGETSAKLYEEGVPVVDGTAAVNGYMPTLLGMTHAEFSASFMVRQKDVARIAGMQPTERVAFIRSVMGMGKIDAGLKACRARKSELSQEMDGLIRGLGERGPLEEAVEDASGALLAAQGVLAKAHAAALVAGREWETAEAAFDTAKAQKEEHDRHLAAWQRAKDLRDAAEKDVERAKAKLAQVRAAAARLSASAPDLARLPELRAERDALVDARGVAGERRLLVQREKDLGQTIANLRALVQDNELQIKRYDEEADAAANRVARAADERLAALRTAREQERVNLLAQAQSFRKEADRHKRRLDAIQGAGKEGDCPTCARRLGEAFEEVEKVLRSAYMGALGGAAGSEDHAEEYAAPSDDEIEAAADRDAAEAEVERHNALRKDAEQARKVLHRDAGDLANAEKALREATARLEQLPEAEFDPARLKAVEEEVARLDALDKKLAGDRAMAAQEAETESWLTERGAHVQAAEDGVQAAMRGVAESGFDANAYMGTVERAEEARRASEAAKVALARAEEAAKATAGRVADARAALADYDTRGVRLEEVRAEHLTHEQAAARLAEFRVAIAATIRPEMEELMSGFVHLLTDGRHEAVTLSEEFDATLHESGVPVEVVSGGTEDIAALAMRLALSVMLAERSAQDSLPIFLDEPFGSLDETRRGNVLSLIRHLRNMFPQVVVISHVAETRDAVDHVVELEYDEEAGRARVVSAPAIVAEVA